MESVLNTNSALLIIDVQNDFVSGSLAVSGSMEIIPKINSLIEEIKFNNIIYTKDNHPENHVSFKGSSSSRLRILLDPLTEKYRGAFAVHCVQGTFGSEIHKDLIFKENSKVFCKGENKLKEEFSGFSNPNLDLYLKENLVKKVFIVGLTFDFCVSSTAYDSISNGYETYILKDCSKSINAENEKTIEDEMRSKGIKIIESSNIKEYLS